MITDSHAHLFWGDYDADREEVLARARAAGVERMVIVGTDLATSRAAFELCRGRAGLFPTAGVHPHDASALDAASRAALEELCRRSECVGIGETGLDYFKEYSPREHQREGFRWHIALARALDKPLVVHSRDAHPDTAALLAEQPGVRGVMHCYTMGPEELPTYLELGLCISFSGVVTYKRNEANREAARLCPEDRLLVETDCPFLSPEGSRGKRNEPAHARTVLERIAQVRGVDSEHLARVTSANAARLFDLEQQAAPASPTR